MQTLAKAMLTMTATLSLIGCVRIDDAAGLEALRDPLVTVGHSVLRIGDEKLTGEFRNVVSVYRAALGE